MFSAQHTQNVNNRFLALLELLNSLHEDFGVKENQGSFDTLSNICEQMQTLFTEKISDQANTFISTLSGAVQTHIPLIAVIALEYSNCITENPDLKIKLMDKVVKITTNLNRLVTTYETFISRAQQGLLAESFEPGNCRVRLLIEALKQAPANSPQLKMSTLGESTIILVDNEESLNTDNKQERVSCLSFFSRTATDYPKTVMAGAITTSMSLAYSGLSLLSYWAGPTLDALLHTDVTGVSHQTIIAATLLLTGSGLGALALMRTCLGSSEIDQESSSESEFLLKK